MVVVNTQLVELETGERIRTPPKTEAGKRRVALPPFVARELERHLDLFVGADPDSPLFAGERDGTPTRANWARICGRARDKAGLPVGVHLHDLRHAGATLAAQGGATTKELMARLGHASPRAALIYQHAAESRDHAIASLLEELVARQVDNAAGTATAARPTAHNRRAHNRRTHNRRARRTRDAPQKPDNTPYQATRRHPI